MVIWRGSLIKVSLRSQENHVVMEVADTFDTKDKWYPLIPVNSKEIVPDTFSTYKNNVVILKIVEDNSPCGVDDEDETASSKEKTAIYR